MATSSYLPSNLNPVDSADFSFKFDYMRRHPGGAAYSRFGMLDDPSVLQDRMRERGGAPGNNWSNKTGSGSVRINKFGSGGTPSDPGGHNWDTVDNMFTNTQKLVSGHKGRLDRARQLEMNKQSYNTNKQLSAWLQSQGFPSASGQQGMGNQQDMGEQSADNSQPKQPSWIFRTRVGQRAAQKAGDLAVRGIDKLESAWNKRRAGNIPQDTDQSEFDIDDPFRPFE